MKDLFLSCLCVFAACVGVCVMFNLRRRALLLASLGAALGWFIYLLTAFTGNDIVQCFAATLAVSAYAEILARVNKAPVTVFLIVGIIPMVPGGGIYYAMEYCLRGDMENFLTTGLHTFGIAGAIAVGILLVSSLARLFLKK
ncbi:MAG: threonine/serine exporter [Clostridiales bacterium]|nr:threonine/serine exporter [Clostridiales bacterium]